jgi:hypothetical protein
MTSSCISLVADVQHLIFVLPFITFLQPNSIFDHLSTAIIFYARGETSIAFLWS